MHDRCDLEELGQRISEQLNVLEAITDERRVKVIRAAIRRLATEWCRASLAGVTDEGADRMSFRAAAERLSITESDVGELLRWGVLYDYADPPQVSRRGVEDLRLAIRRPDGTGGMPAAAASLAWEAWWKRLLTSDTAPNSVLWGVKVR